MLGSIIGQGISAIGGILGGIAKKKSINATIKALEEQQAKNESWYNRRYNEDSTQRADAQRILTMTEEAIRNRGAAGAAAVTGATDEAVAAQKAANTQALADATAQIAAAGEQRKDSIEQQYRATDAQLEGQKNGLGLDKGNMGMIGLF